MLLEFSINLFLRDNLMIYDGKYYNILLLFMVNTLGFFGAYLDVDVLSRVEPLNGFSSVESI